MNGRTCLRWISAGAFAICGAAAAQQYGYRIELKLQGPESTYRAELPAEVYRGATRSDLGDLRIANAAGEPVPFALVTAAARGSPEPTWRGLPLFPVRRESGGAPTNLELRIRQRADGSLVSLAARNVAARGDAKAPPAYVLGDASALEFRASGLRLGWTARADFSATVAVEASDDLKAWREIAPGAPLVDLSFGGERLRRDWVEFAPLRAKYYRLTLSAAPAEITRLELREAAEAPEAPRRTISAPARQNPRDALAYEFDLGGLFRIDRVAVQLPQPGALAPVEIEGRGDSTGPWQKLGKTVVYRLTTGGGAGDLRSGPHPVPATSLRYLRLRADPRSGGLGTGELRLEASYLPRHVVFVARGKPPFAIEYGRHLPAGEREQRDSAALPLATLLPSYREGDEWRLPEASVAAAALVNARAVERSLATDLDLKKAVLWAVLVAAVLALGAIAWRISSRKE